ncbi:glycoside hydrolase family 6 protein [Actinoplanes bogorensis]|uniref:Glucanase n=1 Tax=Paractinoplanes bogorensis TaxID=1610840 RepID=A0ABS5YWU9_9ACTN|nr:glycoside hydrolase family 6 protein [Actinoplanes bogorensis]MBU2667853.1 glycoside hydrolase family 6 protein [Actinoplanes bogorensis]
MVPSPPRRRLVLAAVSLACVTAGVAIGAGTASAGTLSGTLYRDPDTAVARWVAANPGDSRTALISSRIASQPATRWLSNFNLSTVQSEVSTFVGAAAGAGQVPALTVYGIPNRDCGGASAGGAPDLTQYQTWVGGIARGLAGRTTLILLEPDSIALQTCLSAGEITARDQALATATRTLKAAGAKVYLDGGHSAWNAAGEQARRLAAAGVADADGFYTNASNFQSTANETAFGRSVLSSLSGSGIAGKRQVIDTSRNGGAAGDWCGDDNTDRRIGRYPTLDTGDANIDAYLWIKPPGEADGCAFPAGSFQPALASSLATGSANPPATTPPATTPPATTPPVTTPPATTPPATTPPPATGSCAATYTTSSSWNGGFQGAVAVKAGSSAINGWSVSWPLASGQSISQVWGGTLSVSGSTVTVRNAAWNGSLQPGAAAEFGFIASGPAGASGLACSA